MKRKRLIVRNRKRKQIYLVIFISIFSLIGLGYAALNSNLKIIGNLIVTGRQGPLLYNVLKNEAKSNSGLAKEYVGAHQDSMSGNGNKNIYYYYGSNSENAGRILNKNNVIFAGHCWQMIRTTDTGGVKMIYNGESENGECFENRGNHVGYESKTVLNLSSDYWYGTSYTYDSSTNLFKISGKTETKIWNESTSEFLIGKYTCMGTNVEETCQKLYLIESIYDSTSANAISLYSNSSYSIFGTVKYNEDTNSVSNIGYMYNKSYPAQNKSFSGSKRQEPVKSLNVSTSHWYADSVEWDDVSNVYKLVDPYQINDYSSAVGKYTFKSIFQSSSGGTVYYITSLDNSTGSNAYYIELSSGNDVDYYNDSYTYGDNIIDNGNGSYTIENPVTFKRIEWPNFYKDLAGKFLCINAVNNICNEIYEIESSYSSYFISNSENPIKYSSNFIYEDGIYKLSDDSIIHFNPPIKINNMNNYHYTCWNSSGECETLSYIYYVYDYASRTYYINLNDGKNVDDALNDMLYGENVNQNDSIAKFGLEAWFKQRMDNYSDYLEDIIFCNNRTISNKESNGWKANGGNINTEIKFSVPTDLSCPNITDQFSVSNSLAPLKYKVGLITSSEATLLGTNEMRKSSSDYMTMSSDYFHFDHVYVGYIQKEGNPFNYSSCFSSSLCSYRSINSVNGLRPVISLKPGTEYISGDGSKENPYTILKQEVPIYYNIKIENSMVEANKTLAKAGMKVTLLSKEKGKIISSFKINGKLIEGTSFIMPDNDVVISDVILGDIILREPVVIESEHNPYSNNLNKEYEELFEGANTLTIELDYQTESTSYDWIYLYDKTGKQYGKYGGKTRMIQTITIPGDYVKILFHTDSSGNNYYGFKATITPNYD